MKTLLQPACYTLLLLVIGFLACNKETNPGNQPPVANAGTDEVQFLPKDSIILDGTASKDPDGTISKYQWSKIAGPASYAIRNPAAAQTAVNKLSQGVYQFELTVTDNGGLTAKDTVQITINPASTASCDISGRSQIHVTVTQIGTLSEPRCPYVAAANGKIVFAGGYSATVAGISATVDIYDVANHTWTTAQLSQARESMAAVSCGNYIFFAGGRNGETEYDNVDIYDAVNNK